jgi:hypothetical protein
MTQQSPRQERKRHPRFPLDLPLDHGVPDSPNPYGGIAINGSESGLLIYSLQDMPVGTHLNVAVLFADEFEFTYFDALTKVVRKVYSGNGQRGYGYGLLFVRISEENFRRLRRLLRTCEWVHPDNAPPLANEFRFLSADQRRPPEKKGISLPGFLKKLNISGGQRNNLPNL